MHSVTAAVSPRLNESGFIDYGRLLGETHIERGHGDANVHSNVEALCEFKALSTEAHGFCANFGLAAFRPFGAGEFSSAMFEPRRSDGMDARNFFAASTNCLERNRLRGALTTDMAGIAFMSLLADNPDQVSRLTALEKRLAAAATDCPASGLGRCRAD